MEIEINRKWKKPHYTIGRLSIDGEYFCDTLEDTDRGLTSDMSKAEIAEIKIPGATAIPTGRYSVVFTYSPKFKKNMPLVCGVPGFEAIRIHPGNTNQDTDGCILPGKNTQVGKVLQSRKYFNSLEKQMYSAIFNGERIHLTIKA